MKVYTYSYNRNYNPSAPFVEIELIDYDETLTPISIIAQVDSGSDASALPLNLLHAVEARFQETQIMREMSGFTRPVDMYLVGVRLAGETFFRRVIALPNGSEAIIGRDVLNHLSVTLNSPATMTEILSV